MLRRMFAIGSVLILVLLAIGAAPAAADTAVWSQQTGSLFEPPSGSGPMSYDPVTQQTVLLEADQTWIWDGSTWSVDGTSPGDGISTFDKQLQEIVLWNDAGSIWAWDGSSWSNISPLDLTGVPNGGGISYNIDAIGYDDRTGAVVLSGERDECIENFGYSCAIQMIFQYGPGGWSAVEPSPSPGPTAESTFMPYDPINGMVMLWDGSSTWETDGTNWYQLHPQNEPPAGPASMSTDPSSGLPVLFSGDSTGGPSTWEWTGTNWVQLATSTSPTSRVSAAMSQDPQGIVLFGGQDPSSNAPLGDTWTLRLTEPPPALPEAANVVTLPVAGVFVGAAAIYIRRRRSGHARHVAVEPVSAS